MHVVEHDVSSTASRSTNRLRGGRDPRAPRRRRPAGRAAARPSAHAYDVARGWRRGSRSRLHRRLPGPARLRRVVHPADDADHEPYSNRAMARDVVAVMARSARALRRRRARPRRARGARAAIDPPAVSPARRHGRRPGRRGAGALRRALRRRVVALVLPRPDGQAGRGVHLARPRRLVQRRTRSAWARELRRLAARDPRPGDRARDGRGLPRRPRIDRAHEEADRAAGRRVACPPLCAWSVRDDLEELYGDPLEPWRAWVAGDTRSTGSTPGTTSPRRPRRRSPPSWRGSLG